MPDIALSFLLLFVGVVGFGILLGRKDRRISDLEDENFHLKRLIRRSNVCNTAPKNLEE